MDTDLWQRLLNLESRDIVSKWFGEIHGRQLNARRAKEIVASARQGREYFRSASSASFAVRPLLAFYGVAALTRAVTLLRRRDGGEECLTKGHGLETIGWSDTLSGDLPRALGLIGSLKVRTCSGLFQDLELQSQQRPVLHIYDKEFAPKFVTTPPPLGFEISLDDIVDRLPDFFRRESKSHRLWVRVKKLDYSPDTGAQITIECPIDDPLCAEFAGAGFTISKPDDDAFRLPGELDQCVLRMANDRFLEYVPQVLHLQLHKTMGGWSSPFLVSEFAPRIRYSQMAVTYALSFFLGMLARYFPTHWSALMSGEKGDAIWPTINLAQKYVETATPELVIDMVNDAIPDSIHTGKDDTSSSDD